MAEVSVADDQIAAGDASSSNPGADHGAIDAAANGVNHAASEAETGKGRYRDYRNPHPSIFLAIALPGHAPGSP